MKLCENLGDWKLLKHIIEVLLSDLMQPTVNAL